MVNGAGHVGRETVAFAEAKAQSLYILKSNESTFYERKWAFFWPFFINRLNHEMMMFFRVKDEKKKMILRWS
jgi:hypothetical protein